ncbi:MAG: YIP1 family protein [Cyanobacteriota bacterium]|nr:YIP1 family protein [Cyanobacteriota bacterium]
MLDTFLDNLYGTWFFPDRTFRSMRQTPLLWQAALVVALLSGIDGGRRSGFDPWLVVGTMLGGCLGWLAGAGLLWLLASSFGRSASLSALLMISGFAGLPWLFLAPAQALGGIAGSLLGLLALLWFVAWQLWGAAIALDLPWWRLGVLVLLTFCGGAMALNWLGSGWIAVTSLMGS